MTKQTKTPDIQRFCGHCDDFGDHDTIDHLVIFTGCKYLDYGDHFVKTCTKNLISIPPETKVVWDRIDIDGNYKLCQFCQKRGRLNFATACLSLDKARCSDYEEFTHKVPIATINLD